VANLQFRLKATDEKVEFFLQTLSSMHASFSSDSAEAAPMEEPRADLGVGHDRTQHSTEKAQEQGEREHSVAEEDSTEILKQSATTKADGTMGEVQVDRKWADQVAYVEEEPGQRTSTPHGRSTYQVSKFIVFYNVVSTF
jgi:hypothetical protein